MELFTLDTVGRGQAPGRELIVDSFAGGGGASTGIEMALGRSPDVAINHDAVALAMHAANHPATLHLSRNIWQVDPVEAVKNRPVGLAWFSPDCKHHSKAKGGRPVKRSIRDLAWVVVLWARRVRPRVIVLENVEEFRDWGPLIERAGDWYPDPDRRGQTFDRWVGELRRLGYRVEWRELRACDYGAPTIRKRLFLIARRDGRPIAWPEPTHGRPDDPDVVAGRKRPWRTAAEVIDWSLPCPSIFETSEQILAKWGVRAKRPLAEATLARIARGVMRYVVEAARPFIVPITHAGDARVNSADEPLRTQTTAHRGEHALVMPFVAGLAHGDSGGRREYAAEEPLTTIHAGGNNQAVVTPFVTKFRQNSTGHRADEPLHTVTANGESSHPGGASPLGIVAPFLVPRYQERPGQAPRSRSVEEPVATIVPDGNGAQVVAAFLAQHNEGPRPGQPGRPAGEPVSTITATGAQQGLVAAMLSHAYTSNTAGGQGDPNLPLKTVVTGGHASLVAAFLAKYYGAGLPSQSADEPLHSVTTRPRHGLVTVTIAGEPYVIVDIGMRMLTPRERFLAQGFPRDYVIDRAPDGASFTGEAQGRMVGNSVCPPLAAALVAANVPELAEVREAAE